MNKTSALVKRLREVHHLSQMEISRRTGISQTRISRWEADTGTDGSDAALKLAELLAALDQQQATSGGTPQPAGA